MRAAVPSRLVGKPYGVSRRTVALGTLGERLTPYRHPHVLVFDARGYFGHAADAANARSHVGDGRYPRRQPILAPTNEPLAAWGRSWIMATRPR